MEKQLIRVGTEDMEIKSKLNPRDGFNLLFGARHEFVYLANFHPWQHVNGTWTGALGHLMNDNRMDWNVHCVCLKHNVDVS